MALSEKAVALHKAETWSVDFIRQSHDTEESLKFEIASIRRQLQIKEQLSIEMAAELGEQSAKAIQLQNDLLVCQKNLECCEAALFKSQHSLHRLNPAEHLAPSQQTQKQHHA